MRTATWLVACLGLGLSIGVPAADPTFGPAAVTPAAHSFNIGKLKLTALHDAQFVFPNDGKTFGVDSTDRKSSRLNSSHLRTSRMPSSA